MKPIQLPKETIKALLAPSNMFIVPIKEKITVPKDVKYPEKPMYLDVYNHGYSWYWWTQDGRQELSQEIVSPLKVGDRFYIQEEYSLNRLVQEDNEIVNVYMPEQIGFLVVKVEIKRVAHLNEYELEDLQFKEDEYYGEHGYYIDEDGFQCDDGEYEKSIKQFFTDWFNKQYPETPYEDNPYVFLYSFERSE